MLYQYQETAPFNLSNDSSVRLTQESKQNLDKEIQSYEIKDAIKSMRNGRTPGNDGLPVEFYKIFWPQIGDILTQTIKHGLDSRCIHASARQGILNLIPKQRWYLFWGHDLYILRKLIRTKFKNGIIMLSEQKF